MALQKITALALLALLGAALVSARPMEAEGAESAGRQLLAATDNRFNTYKNDPQCKGVSSLMVCKSCTASNLVNAKLNTKDGGFQIFCFDSGDITNNGDGGADNWQFSGCFTRDGFQGHNVHFKKC